METINTKQNRKPRRMNTKKKKLKIIEELKTLQEEGDAEVAHPKADGLLCEFLDFHGHHDIVEEYDKIHKWFA